MSSMLSEMYAHLRKRCEASGQDQRAILGGGLHITVGKRGDDTYLVFRRLGKPVSTTEEIVLRRDCGVPPSAVRIPEVGLDKHTDDAGVWQYARLKWTEEHHHVES